MGWGRRGASVSIAPSGGADSDSKARPWAGQRQQGVGRAARLIAAALGGARAASPRPTPALRLEYSCSGLASHGACVCTVYCQCGTSAHGTSWSTLVRRQPQRPAGWGLGAGGAGPAAVLY
eukprot:4036460-Prymnesium_polylepis.1